jgi:hypothetical protein
MPKKVGKGLIDFFIKQEVRGGNLENVTVADLEAYVAAHGDLDHVNRNGQAWR